MMSKVSIVIPVFQDQTGLDRCLAAIGLQDDIALSDLEVIVVDNGSEPPMRVPKHLPFASKLLTCETKGSYAARNVGVDAANGEFLVFLDADCWPQRSWISAGLKALEKRKEDCIIGGDVKFEESSNPGAVESYQLLMGFGQERSINELKFSATANLFVCRRVFHKVGRFQEELLSGGDREWSWRAAQQGVSVYFSAEAAVYTKPRINLRGALIQARRVAGGRKNLVDNPQIVASVGMTRIQPKRGFWGKAKTILSAHQFTFGRRLMIFGVAMAIRLVHDFERVRIWMGAEPERR